MNTPSHSLLAFLLSLPLLLIGCGDHHHDDHGGHDHGHDHGSHAGHDHDHEGGEHIHEENVGAGPNGGHVVKSEAGFALEVVVDALRKAHIRMLDADGKVTALGEVSISGIAGERSSPVKLTFAPVKGGGADVLVSDQALPEGAHVPMILVVKTSPTAAAVTERFEVHLH